MQTGSAAPGVVRVRVPAAIAADLRSFEKVLSKFAERLGCRACFSGVDCLFHLERDFVVDEKINVSAAERLKEGDPDGNPARTASVAVPPAIGGDLKKLISVVGKVAGLLGCSACCSGFDLRFRNELNLIADASGNVQAIHG